MSYTKFLQVAVGSLSAKRQAIFTYCWNEDLRPGQLVAVNLRNEKVIGIVVESARRPRFKTSPLLEVLPAKIPEQLVDTMLWAMDYYPHEKGSVVRLFVPPDLPPKKGLKELALQSSTTGQKLPSLSQEQEQAFNRLKSSTGVNLLHGKTGSGKTIVYIALIRRLLEQGKSVVLLVPEISLGEQIGEVVGRYIDGAIFYNSLMTKTSRRDIWYGLATSTKARLIIGPRSALTLPISNLGAVIIDEAHDASYKQQQAPYYTSQVVAAKLAASMKIPLIYGSATPNVADYYSAIVKNYPIIELVDRPVAKLTDFETKFHLVDTRQRSNFTRSPVLSHEVIDAIGKSLKSGTQSLLLLNRRGTAHLVQCDSCGWQLRCNICDHALVYHKDSHKAICHYCEKSYPMPSSCPEDGGILKLLTIGTKFIEEQCQKLFPGSSVVRLDGDSVTRSNVLDIMKQIQTGDAQIIIGTQLVAKGLDLPLLSVVVVVDAVRQASDYMSDERYYQLLHQVIGRGLRGHQHTNIYLQTPDLGDPIIAWATADDWHSFYDHELSERRAFNYPPFSFLAMASFKSKTSEGAEEAVAKLEKSVSKTHLPVKILGPMPSSGKGRLWGWDVVIKSTSRSKLLEVIKLMPSNWSIDLDAQTS